MDTTAPRSHIWRFFRTCGLDQALLQSGDDLADLASLDQKLWTALSCPTRGVRFDATTLALLDSDNDGRIRVPELLAAIAWLSARLTSLDPLLAGSDTVMLASITTATPEGKAMLANAKRILSNLGKGAADAISLADVAPTPPKSLPRPVSTATVSCRPRPQKIRRCSRPSMTSSPCSAPRPTAAASPA